VSASNGRAPIASLPTMFLAPTDRQKRGRRRISWAWYDPFQNELVRKTGAVEGGMVRHSIVPSAIPVRGNASRTGAATLAGSLEERCTSRSARRPLLRNSDRRVRANAARCGAVALVGDAAHVSSPMTGSGFHYSLLGVLSLRQALGGTASGEAVAPALTQFERARLVDDRRLALNGQRWSRDYLASLWAPHADAGIYGVT
jgi:2-polyprenyl-6-methoxyphenol hydroxylase-like FAD-dependent oxidoreductase